jgi:hypothetical protein
MGLLEHSASNIVRQLIVDLDLGTDSGTWPVKVSHEPDLPDDCITVYDYTGKDLGKTMDGERSEHPGIQVRTRAADYDEGYAKAEAIAIALDQVSLTNTDHVTIGSASYAVWEVARTGGINFLGKEPGSERVVFTFTAITTIKQV